MPSRKLSAVEFLRRGAQRLRHLPQLLELAQLLCFFRANSARVLVSLSTTALE